MNNLIDHVIFIHGQLPSCAVSDYSHSLMTWFPDNGCVECEMCVLLCCVPRHLTVQLVYSMPTIHFKPVKRRRAVRAPIRACLPVHATTTPITIHVPVDLQYGSASPDIRIMSEPSGEQPSYESQLAAPTEYSFLSLCFSWTQGGGGAWDNIKETGMCMELYYRHHGGVAVICHQRGAR